MLKDLDAAQAYGLAKRVNQLQVLAAAPAWGARGARITSISPGAVDTRLGRTELAGQSGGFLRRLVEHSALSSPARPEQVADVARFLLSPAAGYVTGTDVLVDVGAVAAWTARSRG